MSRLLLFFLKLYFIDYVITVIPIWPLCSLPPNTPHSLSQSPHHCSCPQVMCISSLATPFPILYLTSSWLFCNYLFVLLNPLTSSPLPPQAVANCSQRRSNCAQDHPMTLWLSEHALQPIPIALQGTLCPVKKTRLFFSELAGAGTQLGWGIRLGDGHPILTQAPASEHSPSDIIWIH